MDVNGLAIEDSCISVQKCESELNEAGDSSQPISGSSSQGPEAPSLQCSVTTNRSAEERLRQIRAAEEIRQRQRYAAMIEAQRQADITRQKLQDDRRRKIDAMRQREEARRNFVKERRKELEMSTKARIDQLMEKSASRSHRDFNTLTSSTYRAPHLRTASAAPVIGSNRHPNHLMTSSCMVAFGSSAPRSICTQPSPAALRLKQAFEARLASYLTGRHSGCFLTPSALPQYALMLDAGHHHQHPPHESQVEVTRAINTVSLVRRRNQQHHITMSKQRAVSAHIPRSQQPIGDRSCGRRYKKDGGTTTRASESPAATVIASAVKQGARPARLRQKPTGEEVSSFRSSSSQDFPRIDRKQRVPTAVAGAKQMPNGGTSAPTKLTTDNSARSASADVLSDKKMTVPDVFLRLSVPKPRRNNAVSSDCLDTEKLSDGGGSIQSSKSTASRKPTVMVQQQKKRTGDVDVAASPRTGVTGKPKPLTSRHNAPRGMSASMYVHRQTRTTGKQATAGDVPTQGQSTTPPPTSTTGSSEFWAGDTGTIETSESVASVPSSGAPEGSPAPDLTEPAPGPDEEAQEKEAEETSEGTSTLSQTAGADSGVVSTVNGVGLTTVSSSASLISTSLACEDDPTAGEKSDSPIARDSLSPSPVPSPSTTRTDLPSVNGSQGGTGSTPLTSATGKGGGGGPTATNLIHTGPLKAETRGSGDTNNLSDSEAAIYRAKLVEQRRLAKERKEQEQRRLEEENRIRREQLEEARIAAEKALQSKLEAEAMEAQQAAEEQQRIREEEEKAKQQLLEADRLAKMQRAEEERVLRKKRLDSIMSRLKQGGPADARSPSPATPGGSGLADESEHSTSLAHVASSPAMPDCNGVGNLEVGAQSGDLVMPRSFTEELTLVNTGPTQVQEDGQQSTSAEDAETRYQPSLPTFGLSTSPTTTEDQPLPTAHDLVNHQTDQPVLPPSQEYGAAECDDKSANPVPTSLVTVDGRGDRDLTGLPVTEVTNDSHPTVSTAPSVQFQDLTADDLPRSVHSSPQRQAPKFKSALLQSMLGGGRLATRAKDAVADLRPSVGQPSPTVTQSGAAHPHPAYSSTPRLAIVLEATRSPLRAVLTTSQERKSSTVSLDTLGESNAVGAVANSASPWDGFSALPGDGALNSPLMGAGESPMVRSMFDRPLDRLQANGPNSVH